MHFYFFVSKYKACVIHHRNNWYHTNIVTRTVPTNWKPENLYNSNAHLHFDDLVRLVPNDLKLILLPAINDRAAPVITLNTQLRELRWFAKKLLIKRIDVVKIDMGITHSVNESAGVKIRSMCKDMSEESIGRDVEGHAETHITRALVQHAG